MLVQKPVSIAAAAVVFVLSIAPAAHAGADIAGTGIGAASASSEARSIQTRWAEISAKAKEFQIRRKSQLAGVKSQAIAPRKAFMAMAQEARKK